MLTTDAALMNPTEVPMDGSETQAQLTVFVGSSQEAFEHYEQVCGTLEEQGHDVRGWKASFEKGEGFLAALIRMTEAVDAALLIATPDDLLCYRGEQSHVLRDNVLFEAGLFIGALGRSAAGIVVAGGSKIKLPSDLAGVSTFSLRDGRENAFARDVRRWATRVRQRSTKLTLAR